MKKIKTVLLTTVILTLVCAISAAALGFTNKLTADRIAEAAVRAEAEAMSRIVDAESFEADRLTYGNETYNYNRAISGGEVLAYIFTVSGHGYGGDIKVMVGVNTVGKVLAIEILDASGETPGLGQRVTNPDFAEQFKDKQKNIEISEGGGNAIDKLTGATISTRAVVSSVNTALELFEAITEGGGSNG